jgi:hypothetical protein
LSIFSSDDYRREAEKNIDKEKKKDGSKKPHWEVKHRNASHFKKKLKHCPRLCQQKENGNYGKRTFDGLTCFACGYKAVK